MFALVFQWTIHASPLRAGTQTAPTALTRQQQQARHMFEQIVIRSNVKKQELKESIGECCMLTHADQPCLLYDDSGFSDAATCLLLLPVLQPSLKPVPPLLLLPAPVFWSTTSTKKSSRCVAAAPPPAHNRLASIPSVDNLQEACSITHCGLLLHNDVAYSLCLSDTGS